MKNCRGWVFSLCGLEVRLPAFSCPCSLNVTHYWKEDYATSLSKESMPFVKSKPPLPTRSLRSLRAAGRFTSSFRLHHPCKKIELRYPRFGLQDIDCDLGCLIYDCCESMKNCQDLTLRLRGLGGRLPAFQLPMFMFVKCDALLNLFPPFLFGIPSIHSLPESWGPWEPSSALCLHHAHPFVVVMHWLFSHVTATCPWAADVRNVTHCPKEIGSTCLSNTKESILAIPFWDFQASIPYQKQVPESNSRLHQFCILLASCPSLRCATK